MSINQRSVPSTTTGTSVTIYFTDASSTAAAVPIQQATDAQQATPMQPQLVSLTHPGIAPHIHLHLHRAVIFNPSFPKPCPR